MQRIANPFSSYPHVIANFDDGRVVMSFGPTRFIDPPEGAKVCVITPVAKGRSDAPAVAEPAVWTPDNGVQSIKQYEESARIAKEAKKLKEEQEAAAARKAKEARERKAMKEAVSEKPKKVIEEKKSR